MSNSFPWLSMQTKQLSMTSGGSPIRVAEKILNYLKREFPDNLYNYELINNLLVTIFLDLMLVVGLLSFVM